MVAIQSLPVNKTTIDRAYQQLIKENYLNTWDERLKDYQEMEFSARTILIQLCQHPKGDSRNILTDVLNSKINDPTKAEMQTAKALKMLMNDGYLIESNRRYMFRSPLLRDFWYNRFVK